MRLHPCVFVCVMFLGLLSLTTVASASTPQTFLTLLSQPGDYIGGGITQTFTPADGTFSVTNTTTDISISFHTPSYSQFWTLAFGSPKTQKFGRGEYEGATRTPFRSPTRPGVDVGVMAAGATRIPAAF